MAMVMRANLKQHLSPNFGTSKRILCLDGGGARGLISLGILAFIEELLSNRSPDKTSFRLSHYFDLIAGTSTGSIIATGLALGMKVDEVKVLYNELCPALFGKPKGTGIFAPKYDSKPLEQALKHKLCEDSAAPANEAKFLTLGSSQLETGLLVCTCNALTSRPWAPTNHPGADDWNYRFNKVALKELPLWSLLMASAAAPSYFKPQPIELFPGNHIYEPETGVFIDGALAGYNNPSFQAFLATTKKPYNWPVGENKLFLVSVGTGWWREEHSESRFLKSWAASQTVGAAKSLLQNTADNTLETIECLGSSTKKYSGIMHESIIPGTTGGRFLQFIRYNTLLELDAIHRQKIIKNITPKTIAKLRLLENANSEIMAQHFRIGYHLGAPEHTSGWSGIIESDFPDTFNPPGFTTPREIEDPNILSPPRTLSTLAHGNL